MRLTRAACVGFPEAWGRGQPQPLFLHPLCFEVRASVDGGSPKWILPDSFAVQASRGGRDTNSLQTLESSRNGTAPGHLTTCNGLIVAVFGRRDPARGLPVGANGTHRPREGWMGQCTGFYAEELLV